MRCKRHLKIHQTLLLWQDQILNVHKMRLDQIQLKEEDIRNKSTEVDFGVFVAMYLVLSQFLQHFLTKGHHAIELA